MPRLIPAVGDRVKLIYADKHEDFFGTVVLVYVSERKDQKKEEGFMDVWLDNNNPCPRELLSIEDIVWLHKESCWLTVGTGGE